jgi:hypothetical protein
MKFNSDIDIDFADRTKILEHIKHIPAAMRNVNPIRKHASGVYVTDIPYDAINDMANIDYAVAEKRGYLKLDFLNVHVYSKVRDEMHLIELMREPDWSILTDYERMKSLIHLQNHYQNIKKMPESIDSITRLAMFLAIIRPGKKHLIGLPWKKVAETVWDKSDDGYTFKRSHSVGYAHLVCIHMNLLSEEKS